MGNFLIKTWRFLVYPALLLTHLTFACSSESSIQAVKSHLPRLESLIQKSMKQKNIPGLAVAVIFKGKIVYMKGFGVRTVGQQEPINIDTLFQIGSTSKAISSTLVAILKRDEMLHLDQPVEMIEGITLRHIMSHTTGIPSAGFNAHIENGGTVLEAIDKLKEVSTEDTPGSTFAYHNVVYNLLTHIIENRVGFSFHDTLRAKLLLPLGMNHTFSTWEDFINYDNKAAPHVLKTIKRKSKIQKKLYAKAPYRKEYTNFPAAGGMSSNIQDMAIFLCAIMGARPDILSSLDLQEFMDPIIHTPDQWQRSHKHRDRITKTQYALGWRHMIFAGHPVVFHGGWIRGFSTIIAYLPNSSVGIVVLQNAESSFPFNLAMQYFDWILDLPPKKWIQ